MYRRAFTRLSPNHVCPQRSDKLIHVEGIYHLPALLIATNVISPRRLIHTHTHSYAAFNWRCKHKPTWTHTHTARLRQSARERARSHNWNWFCVTESDSRVESDGHRWRRAGLCPDSIHYHSVSGSFSVCKDASSSIHLALWKALVICLVIP